MRGVSRGRRGQAKSSERGRGGAANKKGRSASKGTRGRGTSKGDHGVASKGDRGVASKGTRGRSTSKSDRGVTSKGTRGRGASKRERSDVASKGTRGRGTSRGARGGRGSRGGGGRGRGKGKNQITPKPDECLAAADSVAAKLALLSNSRIANNEELNAGSVKELQEMVIPCVLGTVYEQEPVKTCPTCGDNLMWYELSKDEEMLACPNPKCNYPFDEQHAYEIRGKKKDDGKGEAFPPEADNQRLLDEFNCGMMNSNSIQDINNGTNEPMPVEFQTTLQEERQNFLHTSQKILNADPLVDISAAEATYSFPSTLNMV